jgi:hypothetical protein
MKAESPLIDRRSTHKTPANEHNLTRVLILFQDPNRPNLTMTFSTLMDLAAMFGSPLIVVTLCTIDYCRNGAADH